MKFQLPDDKKERKKVVLVICIFSLIVLYAIIMFGFIPYRARVRMHRDRLAELEDKLWQAERDIRQIPQTQKRNIEAINHILDVSGSAYILRPRLGNYLLVAESFLEEIAQQAGIRIYDIREASSPPPPSQGDSTATDTPALWPYTVSFRTTVGIHDLMQFIHSLQNANPYLTLINVSITAGSDNGPAKHVVNASVQWPVWKDHEKPNQLTAERLSLEEQ